MLIACEKCTTTYVLDDRLIPPGGAPVQCTRCSHIFVALPEVKAAPAVPEPAPPARAEQPPPRASPGGTRIFGRAGSSPPAGEAGPAETRRTQIFGALGGGPAGQPPRPVVTPTEPVPAITAAASPAAPASRPSAGGATMIFGQSGSAPVAPAPVPAAHETMTMPFGVPVVSPSPLRVERPAVELPPEPPRPSVIEPGRAEDPELDLRGQIRRRNQLALLCVGALLLGLVGYFGARAFLRRAPAPPAELAATRETAISKLRRDDSAAKKEAVAALQALLRAHPDYLEGRADLLVALALQLDDARLAVKRLNAASEALNRQVTRLKEKQAPADWESQVNALVDQLGDLKKKSDPLIDAASGLDSELNSTYRALMAASKRELSAEANQILVRAQAVYFGVKGGDQALTLSQRYIDLSKGQDDGWGVLAYAEYAANTRVAPDTLAQARAAIEEVRKKDSTFLRTHLLSARLAMLEKRYEAASSTLEALLLLNPKHDVAQELLGWVQELQRATSKSEGTAPADP